MNRSCRTGMAVARGALLSVATALLFVGCAVIPYPGPVSDRTSGSNFVLQLDVARGGFRAGEAIEPRATLTYTGPEASVPVWGSSSGIIGFGISTDDARSAGPGYRDDCKPYAALVSGRPLEVAFYKSGGYAAKDPNAAFYRDYFADPILRLPTGTWRIAAETRFYMGTAACAGSPVTLRAVVIVTVKP